MKYKRYLSQFNNFVGKAVVVTGANSGIGLQTAKNLCFLGATVILACRSREKAQAAENFIKAQVPYAKTEFLEYDQADFEKIKAFAAALSKRKIDGFVFNAGICACDPTLKTADGCNLTLYTNFIGAFYLCEILKDKFINDGTRLVFVSSLTALPTRDEPFSSFSAETCGRLYGYSKLCVAKYAYSLMKENKTKTVLIHPGVSATSIVFGAASVVPRFIKNPLNKLLGRFKNTGALSSLNIIKALCVNYSPYLYIRPCGPFGILGKPKTVKLPEKFKDDKFYKEAQDTLKTKNSQTLKNCTLA